MRAKCSQFQVIFSYLDFVAAIGCMATINVNCLKTKIE